jgi:hypothetical protein
MSDPAACIFMVCDSLIKDRCLFCSFVKQSVNQLVSSLMVEAADKVLGYECTFN